VALERAEDPLPMPRIGLAAATDRATDTLTDLATPGRTAGWRDAILRFLGAEDAASA
jgi:hypothetical protein